MSKSTNVSVSMSPQCARAWCRLERLFEAFFLLFLPFISVWGAPPADPRGRPTPGLEAGERFG